MIGIIVIGGHVQGLNIIRIFGEKGIPCILADKNFINIAKHSKYCKKFFHSKSEILSTLVGLDSEYENWIIFPTNDEDVHTLSINKERLEKRFVVSTNDFNTIRWFYNKRKTYELAKKINIPFPRTWMPDSIEELYELDITFPCIIKPAIMHSFYKQSKKKVFLCRNKIELELYYKKAIAIIPVEEIIIQEVIPYSPDILYSVGILYNKDKAEVSLVARRKRQHPIKFGNATTYAELVQNEKLLDYSKRILNKVEYAGLCEVEFIYDIRDGEYKFLEVNPRTWKWHGIAKKSNHDLLLKYYSLLTNHNFNHNKKKYKVAFKHIITDFPTVLNMIFKGLYKRPKKFDIQYAVFDKHDIKPFLFEFIYLLHNIRNR
jgi:predicted ATP-grasp superfamily ATP-dependent carboligase